MEKNSFEKKFFCDFQIGTKKRNTLTESAQKNATLLIFIEHMFLLWYNRYEEGVVSMLFSIPAKYLENIQEKLDINLLIQYRYAYYAPSTINLDKLEYLYHRNSNGEKVIFKELANWDKTYLQVIEDIKKYAENDFSKMFDRASNESDVSKIMTKRKHSWDTQRRRWSNNVTVRKKAMNVLDIINKNFTREQWIDKYKCYTLDEYMARMEEKTQDWDKNREYFYKFPFFEYLTETQKKNGLKHDIDRNLFELLKKDQLFDFYISKTNYLLDKPIFTEKKEQIKMQDENGVTKSVVNIGDDAQITYLPIPKEKNIEDRFDIMKTLDPDDSRLIDYIMTHIGSNLYTDARSSYTLSELATKVLGWHGSSGVENVKKRLLNLVRPIHYSDGDTEMNLTIFDSCIISQDKVDKNAKVEQQIATVIPGFAIKEAYIKNQLTYIAKNQYEELDYPLSRHICYNLQRDRIGLASYNQPLNKKYDLKYFDKIVQFGTNDKKYKFDAIKKSLEEFVQKKFIVKEYEIIKNGFIVHFYELSESERKDLENIRKIKENKIIEEQKNQE